MPVIALLTDFGTRDPYVAAIRAVIASRCHATLIDLTHDIEPFDVFGAAWFLRTAAPEFTGEEDRPVIFLCVVDPGVGSERRILLAARGHQMFLAPDNGLLSLVALEGAARLYSVENQAYFLPAGSTTFHGRDRFAPAAVSLARGLEPTALGPRVDLHSMVRLPYAPPDYQPDSATGMVVALDRFGNAITDIEASRIGVPASVRVGGHEITRRATNYTGEGGETFFLTGSSGTIEISASRASAAEKLQIGRFDRVEVRFAP
jgi:hypothetical protein